MSTGPYANQAKCGPTLPPNSQWVSRQALFSPRIVVTAAAFRVFRSELTRTRRRDDREGGRPDSIVSRETRTHVAEAPRAHRTRRPQGERAPRIVTRPRLSRGKKPGKEDGPGTLFTRRGRARETSRRVFFARIAVEWHRDGVFSRSCGARLVRASPRSSRRARTQSPVARFPHREGNFSVNVHGGFFPRDSGRRRAGCSTRARDHLNPGFSRMNPPGVLRATVQFPAYYTRHHRTRRGDTIATH